MFLFVFLIPEWRKYFGPRVNILSRDQKPFQQHYKKFQNNLATFIHGHFKPKLNSLIEIKKKDNSILSTVLRAPLYDRPMHPHIQPPSHYWSGRLRGWACVELTVGMLLNSGHTHDNSGMLVQAGFEILKSAFLPRGGERGGGERTKISKILDFFRPKFFEILTGFKWIWIRFDKIHKKMQKTKSFGRDVSIFVCVGGGRNYRNFGNYRNFKPCVQVQ